MVFVTFSNSNLNHEILITGVKVANICRKGFHWDAIILMNECF